MKAYLNISTAEETHKFRPNKRQSPENTQIRDPENLCHAIDNPFFRRSGEFLTVKKFNFPVQRECEQTLSKRIGCAGKAKDDTEVDYRKMSQETEEPSSYFDSEFNCRDSLFKCLQFTDEECQESEQELISTVLEKLGIDF